jgi:hypothetical protein
MLMKENSTVNIEVKLGRDEYRSLLARLQESPVSLQVKRGRITAEATWMQLEISGSRPDVDQALKLSLSAQAAH